MTKRRTSDPMAMVDWVEENLPPPPEENLTPPARNWGGRRAGSGKPAAALDVLHVAVLRRRGLTWDQIAEQLSAAAGKPVSKWTAMKALRRSTAGGAAIARESQ